MQSHHNNKLVTLTHRQYTHTHLKLYEKQMIEINSKDSSFSLCNILFRFDSNHNVTLLKTDFFSVLKMLNFNKK